MKGKTRVKGLISGWWLDANGGQHGFIRTPAGTITSYNYPKALYTAGGGINATGVVTGSYEKTSTSRVHGFTRTK